MMGSMFKHLSMPFDGEELSRLRAGDYCRLSGALFTARDAAHLRLTKAIEAGDTLPFELRGQTIYYVGPCMRNGKPISAGPTTSFRMDAYAPTLYRQGVAATIGKGDRGENVYEAIRETGGVYFAAIGGAGALYANAIKSSRLVAYPELGTEAVYRFEVEEFPVIVAIDAHGCSIYER